MLCPSCRHTASLHYPDGCHGKNLQCDCMLGRDEVYASVARTEAPRTPARVAKTRAGSHRAP